MDLEEDMGRALVVLRELTLAALAQVVVRDIHTPVPRADDGGHTTPEAAATA